MKGFQKDVDKWTMPELSQDLRGDFSYESPLVEIDER